MSGTISPRDRLQLWVNTFLLKQKENSGSVTATFRDREGLVVDRSHVEQKSKMQMWVLSKLGITTVK